MNDDTFYDVGECSLCSAITDIRVSDHPQHGVILGLCSACAEDTLVGADE